MHACMHIHMYTHTFIHIPTHTHTKRKESSMDTCKMLIIKVNVSDVCMYVFILTSIQ